MLGKVIEGDAERDAIHVAIAPAMAACKLHPGQEVGIDGHGQANPTVQAIGIVDPFLKECVYAGTCIYVCLFPETVTGMRHHWSHPAFDNSADKSAESDSVVYLKAFAEDAYLSYDQLLDILENYCKHDEHFTQQGTEAAREAYGQCNEEVFWKHVKTVTGLEKPAVSSWSAPFCCTC